MRPVWAAPSSLLIAHKRQLSVALVSAGLVAALAVTHTGPQGAGTRSLVRGAEAGTAVTVRPPAPVLKRVAHFVPRNASSGVRPVRPDAVPGGVSVVTVSAQQLFSEFRSIGYRLEDLRKGAGAVPRVFVKAMPKDIGLLRSIQRRKAVFIKTMLPMILHINEELRSIRARVQALTARESGGNALTAAERDWLAVQYDRFGVDEGDLDTLLKRIDVIPPSLAMAQGAEESGWGSSRFALEGRALFGQRTFKKAPGMVPLDRPEGERFKVRSFDHLLDGVRSYVHNLNTHPAYVRFRELRARLRADAGGHSGIDSLKLVEALKKYSVRGEKYVETIKSIIRFNDLKALDDDRLREAENLRVGTGPV